MKQIYNYIIEKLHLNKNIKTYKIHLKDIEDYFKGFLEEFEGGKYIDKIKYFATRSLTDGSEIRFSINIGSTYSSFMPIDIKDKFLNQVYLILEQYAKDHNYTLEDPVIRISTTIYTFKED